MRRAGGGWHDGAWAGAASAFLVVLCGVVGCFGAEDGRGATAERGPDEPPPPAATPPPARSPIRLLERLDGAEIASPLPGLPVRNWPEDLGADVERTVVFQEDFARFSPARANWPRPFACEVVPRDEGGTGGRALRYAGGGGHRCFFVLPVEPGAHYRVRRSVRTDDPLVDLRLLESRVALRHPGTRNHPQDVARVGKGRFLRAKHLLFVHRFPEASEDEWSTGSLHLFTTPHTRSLVLVVHDTESVVGRTEREARFADLLVERLAPTPAQALSLLKGLAPAEDAVPARGLRKHGQFLPIGEADRVAPPADANFDYRHGLFAPAPTRITFPLTVPPRARFRSSLGLLKYAAAGDEVTFRVLVEAAGQAPALLLERTLRARPDEWHWHDVVFPLREYEGQPVRLTLQTLAPEGARGYGIWGSPVVDVPRRPGAPPNVILIAVDTLRADRLSAYGYARQTSPHLDTLAADGVRFHRAIASSNWTSPSFATLFTGLPSSRHQVIHRASAVAPGFETLAELFRAGGWATHAVVYKPYLYNMGFEQGFDTWFNVPRIDVTADDNLARVRDWLAANGDRRFFLFLHLNDPHQPFNQPAPFDRRFDAAAGLRHFGLKLPIVISPTSGVVGCRRCGGGTPDARLRQLARDLYDGEIAYLDDRLGQLLATLKERGLYDSSWIVFTADHGELLYERGNYFGHGSHRLVDELLWVPLIVKPPRGAGWPTGEVVEARVPLADLMPTLADAVGLPVDDLDLPAESLVPLLKAPGAAQDRDAISENVKHHVLSVRSGEWTYVLAYPPGRAARERLYRGGPYPTRRKDLAAAHPDVLARLRGEALEFLRRNRSGRYLLVTGDATSRDYRLRLTAARPLSTVRRIAGLARQRRVDRRTIELRGRGADLLLFARLPGRGSPEYELELSAPGAPAVHRVWTLGGTASPGGGADSLTRQLDSGELAARLYQGPRPIVRRTRSRLSADRIEALRALGYVE